MIIDYWHIMLLTHLYSSYLINCQVKKIFLQTYYHTYTRQLYSCTNHRNDIRERTRADERMNENSKRSAFVINFLVNRFVKSPRYAALNSSKEWLQATMLQASDAISFERLREKFKSSRCTRVVEGGTQFIKRENPRWD